MSWKSYAREVDRANRRAASTAKSAQRAATREQQRLQKEYAKAQQLAYAEEQVERYENYLELLMSLHKETGLKWDWHAVQHAPQPPQPTRGTASEAQAQHQRNAYVPSFFANLFGTSKKRITELDQAILTARGTDEQVYQAALAEWHTAVETCEYERALAGRVLQGDLSGYRDALEYAGSFNEVADFGTVVESASAQRDAVAITADIRDQEIVPTEIVKATATGKLSTKAMPKGRYWELYQDHVCSCALRLANETFAVLPVDRVIVNIGTQEISSRTGHLEFVTWLAVHFTRGRLSSINLDHIDPSDSMANFDCRMKFAKTKGFSPVEPIGFDDQFVST